ncbi:MAG: hypothetical protein JNM47_05130 [Hyphomonadaceae bacterium]|nr:hypothetical protein [Hyphomonadaceae bacterium]
MKTDEVPQDEARTYGGQKKLMYAVREDGEYTGVKSAGWEVETYATVRAVEELDRLRDDAVARAKAGATSPLEAHMYVRRMDVATLAAVTGIWEWRVKRHFRPSVFAGLSTALLERYAQALDIDVAALKRAPE